MGLNPIINKQREMFDALRKSGLRDNNWDLLILYAQFVVESGYGKNELTLKANNPFAVKAFKSWTGDRYTMEKSPEWDNNLDKIVYYPVDYRKYADLGEAIADYTGLIQRAYPGAYGVRDAYSSYYNALCNGERKYNPHPGYPKLLSNCYVKFRLQNGGEFYIALMG